MGMAKTNSVNLCCDFSLLHGSCGQTYDSGVALTSNNICIVTPSISIFYLKVSIRLAVGP